MSAQPCDILASDAHAHVSLLAFARLARGCLLFASISPSTSPLGVKRIHRNPDRSGSAKDPFESSKIRASADPKKKKKNRQPSWHAWRPAASIFACVDLARSTAAICNNQHAVNIHSHCMYSMFQRDDARLSQAYRYIAGENSWMQNWGSERTEESRKPQRCF